MGAASLPQRTWWPGQQHTTRDLGAHLHEALWSLKTRRGTHRERRRHPQVGLMALEVGSIDAGSWFSRMELRSVKKVTSTFYPKVTPYDLVKKRCFV